MSTDNVFTKANLDDYLKALAKEFKKLNGTKMPAEITLIGGAAVIVNYGFRDLTYDVDAIIHASSAMKEAINKTSDMIGLPNGWLNSDFKKTKSYSPKLEQYSTYYRTFSNVLTVRTISGEYLIAMKLMSGREYKNDRSDIAGILYEQQKNGKEIKFEDIDKAVNNLYGSWNDITDKAKETLNDLLKSQDLKKSYDTYREEEKTNRTNLIKFENEYPNVVTNDNVSDIIFNLRKKRQKEKDIKGPEL